MEQSWPWPCCGCWVQSGLQWEEIFLSPTGHTEWAGHKRNNSAGPMWLLEREDKPPRDLAVWIWWTSVQKTLPRYGPVRVRFRLKKWSNDESACIYLTFKNDWNTSVIMCLLVYAWRSVHYPIVTVYGLNGRKEVLVAYQDGTQSTMQGPQPGISQADSHSSSLRPVWETLLNSPLCLGH